ncbi:PREDICTED: endogenous retrovirus group S71 member 1 Env polyprotein-like [Myotis brandtii]|uniref:endogenous retrovirus group S71 member 1 Env polyprotein-like n=1 Tax=Myotis brandtii TaxID=109478 RepID=UPI000704182F|nr:PREDICTED: endogenous retrovirus group S71 member 1 Env polyprotein-like [Myotis brandtii]
MDRRHHLGPLKDKTFAGIKVLTFFLFCASGNPHKPRLWDWELQNGVTGKVIAHTTVEERKQVAFIFDLCSLLGGGVPPEPPSFQLAPRASGGPQGVCGTVGHERRLQTMGIYICPGSGKVGTGCLDSGAFYCPSWGCETISTISGDQKNRDPHISFQKLLAGPSFPCKIEACNPVEINVTSGGDFYWSTRRTWGIRIYATGVDPGALFTIQRRAKSEPMKPIGLPSDVALPIPVKPPQALPSPETKSRALSLPLSPSQEHSLLAMLGAVHHFINTSQPTIGKDCWLCLDPRPPYYVGVGISQDIPRLRGPNNCSWDQPKLTLGDLQGQGTCLLSPNFPLQQSPYADSCNQTHWGNSSFTTYYQAPEQTWFACTNGLTKCASSELFKEDKEPLLCVLVYILPQVFIYNGNEGRAHIYSGLSPNRYKRAPVLVPLLLSLGVVGSTAVGASALIKGDINLKELSGQVDIDIRHLQSSISHLETQLDSLAEVVLQNRRGLDLLFMNQGGLCMALGETCCFYANNSGIIRESLDLDPVTLFKKTWFKLTVEITHLEKLIEFWRQLGQH